MNQLRRVVATALIAVAFGAAWFFAGTRGTPTAEAAPPPALDVFFAPGPACREAAVRVIDDAKFRVAVSAYGLSSRPVIAALKRAKARGVDVELVVDRTNANRSAVEMARAGITTHVDDHEPINHMKGIVADRVTVLWGSANWTPSSERDHEICTKWTDAAFGARVEADLAKHAAHSRN